MKEAYYFYPIIIEHLNTPKSVNQEFYKKREEIEQIALDIVPKEYIESYCKKKS